ncbi:hypothetical protein RIF29_02809 [Crotalaria pallida]|uniref:Uncharacterized protein n=1 Tax=Crotalaria pallida TaxID=3830 RepID=A0AAN9IZ40_CROPI
MHGPWCEIRGTWCPVLDPLGLVHGALSLVRDHWCMVWCEICGSWCMVRDPRCIDPGAWSGATSLAPGAWCMVRDPWCMDPGAWSGARSVVPGAWCMVHGALSLVRDPCTKGQESDRPQVRLGRDGTGSFEVASWAMHARGIVAFLDLAPWRNASKGIILFGLSLSVTKHGPFDAILAEFIEKPNEMSWHCPWGVHAPHGRTRC